MAGKANNVVGINQVTSAVNAKRDEVMKLGFSPKQARSAIGVLTGSVKIDGVYTPLPIEFKETLAELINTVEVDDTDRVLVKAQKDLITMQGRKPWKDELDEVAAHVDDRERLVLGFANATAWMRSLAENRKVDPGALCGKRGPRTVLGKFKKLGFTEADVHAAFGTVLPNEFMAHETRRSRQTDGPAQSLTSLGGGMQAASLGGGSHRQPAPQIDPMKVLDLLMAAECEYPAARSLIEGKTFDNELKVLDLLMESGMFKYADARAAIDGLA